MNEDQRKALRAPFSPEMVGKLPRITCKACQTAPSRVCDQHSKTRCSDCGNYISAKHIHLDYIGHADVTDRLLEVDPEWTWEPMGMEPTGAPALDANGGLWIRLTVAGVTRIGYGHADSKRGGDAVKEAIGDALRNAAMRFGVALDLWRREHPEDDQPPSRASNKAPETIRDTENGNETPKTAADSARSQLKHVCDALQLDTAVVAKTYYATWNVQLRDELNAGRIREFTTRLRNGEVAIGGQAT